MRFDKIRLTQYREFEDDWVSIGFRFGIGFFAAATIFAVIGTLIVNAWFAYQGRNVWYSYANGALISRGGYPAAAAMPGMAFPAQPVQAPVERDTLVPAVASADTSTQKTPVTASPSGSRARLTR